MLHGQKLEAVRLLIKKMINSLKSCNFYDIIGANLHAYERLLHTYIHTRNVCATDKDSRQTADAPDSNKKKCIIGMQ